MNSDLTLAPQPDRGPIFVKTRPVRTGDINAAKALRLDGVARYLQDIATDNIEAIEAVDTHPFWIVRRTVIDVIRPAIWPEYLTMTRWCSAFSTRWANMRVRFDGSNGALIETEGFWIHISAESGMPTRMSDDFMKPLEESTDEHRLKWKRVIADNAPDAEAPGVIDTPFTLRVTDIDPFDHVNNAVYWQAVEEVISTRTALRSTPHRAVIEYLSPLVAGDDVVLRSHVEGSRLTVWFLVGDALRAVAQVSAL
ncbi:acyl-[acyl-carrier-protein] thioesterase [Rhodococcus globerulus]|uniref:Thioesterase n=1 Tax=Rhodococcus globerulus TaxID=33008 RepID=A0ABU4BUW9_RHOGO|nr:acyl-ACP thioesterase domain-containing protein [Rhodococcus globerulus]MDV6268021.1 thioesterase [Rhodococcus globerulus]